MELIQNSEYLSKLAESIKEERAKSGTAERVQDIMTDTTPVKEFLSGKHCLIGVSLTFGTIERRGVLIPSPLQGTGWWKYEFCYGRYVRQFHGETSLILGFFDEDKHKLWMEGHKHKTPKPLAQRKQLSHFYQGGTVCDKTGKKRETEVVLKCMENAQSPSKVSLYLLEPQTCQYILGVESPLICEILAQADPVTGLIPNFAFQAPETVEKFTIDEAVDEIQVRLQND